MASSDSETGIGRLQNDFTFWAENRGIKLSSKVAVSSNNCCHRFGLIAKDDINPDETLFKVPRPVLLNAGNSSLGKTIDEYDQANNTNIMNGSPSGWVPLLLTLMHELSLDSKSQWFPYLQLIPKKEDIQHPHMWTHEERKLYLSGLTVKQDVDADLENIAAEFKEFALPFIVFHADKFRDDYSTVDMYIHLACFVMAYSFTEEDSSISMVPMADILNHHSNNNSHLVFGNNSLAMTSTRAIKKDEEIFNTFGMVDNEQLLQMYGYVEIDNPYDQVSLSLLEVATSIATLISDSNSANDELLSSKWNYLQSKMDVELTDTADITIQGVINGKRISEIIKVLGFDESDFQNLKEESNKENINMNENNGPSDAKQLKLNDNDESNSDDSDTEDDEDDDIVDLESFSSNLNHNSKAALRRVIESSVQRLGEISIPDSCSDNIRKMLAMQLKSGHKHIYNTIMISLSS